MFDAISFFDLWRRKKKVKQFIIPAQVLSTLLNLTSAVLPNKPKDNSNVDTQNTSESTSENKTEVQEIGPVYKSSKQESIASIIDQKGVSALSLSSVEVRKELQASIQKIHVNIDDLPKEAFTTQNFMEQWNIYAEKLNKSGLMLMCSLMGMVNPKVDGSKVTIELPNEGSKLSFDENKYDLVNYLRKKLNNYDIEIHIVVNEEIVIKKGLDSKDKFKHMNELNPNFEILCRTFALELKN